MRSENRSGNSSCWWLNRNWRKGEGKNVYIFYWENENKTITNCGNFRHRQRNFHGPCERLLENTFYVWLFILQITLGYKPQWRSKTASQPSTCRIFQCGYLLIGWSAQCCGRPRWKEAFSKRHRTNWNAQREGKLWRTHGIWLPNDDCRVLVHFQLLNISIGCGSNAAVHDTNKVKFRINLLSAYTFTTLRRFILLLTPDQRRNGSKALGDLWSLRTGVKTVTGGVPVPRLLLRPHTSSTVHSPSCSKQAKAEKIYMPLGMARIVQICFKMGKPQKK